MSVAELPLRALLLESAAPCVPLRQWRAASATLDEDAPAEGGAAAFWDLLPGGVFVAAIADGSGAPRGAAGATIATRHAAKCVRKRAEANGTPRGPEDARRLVLSACHAARAALMATAERLRISPHDLDCAIRVACCTSDMLACASLGATGLHVEQASGSDLDASCNGHGPSAGPTLTALDALERVRVSVARAQVHRLTVYTAGAAEAVRRLLRASAAPGRDPLTAALTASSDEREASGRIAFLLRAACASNGPAAVLVAALDLPIEAALGPGAEAPRRRAEGPVLLRAA